MKIICTQKEKDWMCFVAKYSDVCFFSNKHCAQRNMNFDCRKCVADNIEWEITDDKVHVKNDKRAGKRS